MGRRSDGYHSLESLVVFTSCGDRLTVRAAAGDAFSIRGPFGNRLPSDGENLVLKARDAMRRGFGEMGGVAIALEKRLPVAAGIGGGSSDAAAALRALARLWGMKGSEARMQSMALDLGADVPMCLAARPLLATGIGEILEPVDGFPSLPVVLVNPGTTVSTPEVFRVLARRNNPPLPRLPSRLDADIIVAWLQNTRNDLETPAAMLAPDIADALSALRSKGAAIARMSGSGATCFGLFPTRAAADAAAGSIAAAMPSWFCVATETTAEEQVK